MRALLTILFFVPVLAMSQPYGNEWINFNQDYYKIMVPDNGLYRITYDDLNNAGFPVDSVDPRLLQMFRRGQQVARPAQASGQVPGDAHLQ